MRQMKKVFSLLLVCCLMFGFSGQMFAADDVQNTVTEDGRVQIVLEFDDVNQAEWAMGYIAKMQSKKVFQGFEDGTFRPNQPVNRVQAIVTAVRLMGLEDEAKAKLPDTKLHFKDADHIDKRFPWAKGYVIVALENGLFDAAEDRIQPDKPASRIWVSSLLVKSLGLQSEALKQMATIPDFKDAKQIPAGAVGYINVAIEQGIVNGYEDGTFQPNKNVTRAEMAALLERTNSGMLESSGAVKVSGSITDIQFNAESVTDAVYNTGTSGEITIESSNDNSLHTYAISGQLLVQYHKRFIRADQLMQGDPVHLVVKDNKVIEASLTINEKIIKKPSKKQKEDKDSLFDDSNDGIREFEVKVESFGKEKVKLKYKNKGKVEAEIEKETNNSKEKLKGEEAIEAIENLLEQASLTSEMSKEEVADQILSALNISKEDIKELEVKVKFSNGKELEIEIENEENEDEEDED
jgi:predicted secreted protein